ncbi:nucleotide sugar dehydrogenase [Roseovarius sp. MBR-38]|jgi:nucleotide sugar dehydrogenase
MQGQLKTKGVGMGMAGQIVRPDPGQIGDQHGGATRQADIARVREMEEIGQAWWHGEAKSCRIVETTVMGMDGRIGNKFLHAGPGYGGSCFPKDTSALARIGQEHGMPMRITETVMLVNDAVKRRMLDKIMDLCGGTVNGKRILILRVTFKPNTDDMREAPALTIVPALVGAGAMVSPKMADLRNIYQ